MDHCIDRIEDKECESESQCEADNADDIKALRISVSIVTFQFICALKVDLLLSYEEEVNEKKCCQRRINARTDR